MEIEDICNNAIDLIGQGTHIDSLEEASPEARSCKRLFPTVLKQCLDFYNWSFARKDEVITKDYLVTKKDDDGNTVEIVSLPWKHSYRMPEDVLRVLFLAPLNVDSRSEKIGFPCEIPFNFRNYNQEKLLVTNAEPDFTIHYQAYIEDIDLLSPSFIQGLEYFLTSRLAANIVKGTVGYQMSIDFMKYAEQFLQRAAALDAQQGANSIEKTIQPASIRARK